jgi:hypothetical protein
MENKSDDGSDQLQASPLSETDGHFGIELGEWFASQGGSGQELRLNTSPH